MAFTRAISAYEPVLDDLARSGDEGLTLATIAPLLARSGGRDEYRKKSLGASCIPDPRPLLCKTNGRQSPDGELTSCALRCADGLVAAGILPGRVVAIEGVRRSEYVVAVCGALLAGGVCAPLDPNYPRSPSLHDP